MKLLRKLIAFITRSFISDCPHCHKHFYGWHKHASHVVMKINNKQIHYRIVCHRCHPLTLGYKKD